MVARYLTVLGIVAAGLGAGCRFSADLDGMGGSTGTGTLRDVGMVTRIQTGEFYQGSQLVLEAVVTGIESANDESYEAVGISGLFISDILAEATAYSGIYVELPMVERLGAYAVGDLIMLNALYAEYYGGSQLEEPDIVKLGTGEVPVPMLIEDPSSVATRFVAGSDEWAPTTEHGPAAASYEGVLIEIRDVRITQRDIGHGMFEVKADGAGAEVIGLAIDKQLFYYQGSRTVGTRFPSLTGLLLYSFDAYKLAPRTAADFVSP